MVTSKKDEDKKTSGFWPHLLCIPFDEFANSVVCSERSPALSGYKTAW